jgi:putative ABC transport system permease protein
LSFGLACFIAVVTYVNYEYSYDEWFADARSIYRINHFNEEGKRYSGIPSALGVHIREELPQVSDVVRVFWLQRMFTQTAIVGYDSLHFAEDKLMIADSNFFKVFTFKFIEGDIRSALKEKGNIVLSKSAAHKYFGDQSALNKFIDVDGQHLVVTGVVEPKGPTHLVFDFLQPIQAYPHLEYTWEHTLAFTYLKLPDAEQVESTQAQLYDLVLKHARSETAEYLKLYRHVLQPLTDIQHTVLDWDIITATPASQLTAIVLIASFVLILAVINFINLSTSRFTERIKEMGINLVLGGTPKTNISQVAVSYFLTIAFACLFSLVLLVLFFPFFKHLMNFEYDLARIFSISTLVIYLLTAAVILALCLIYPQLKFQSSNSIELFRTKFATSAIEQFMRKALIVVQFFIAAVLITCTLTIKAQVNFLRDIDLGFNKDRVLVVRLRHATRDIFNQIRNELLRNKEVENIGGASTAIGLSTGSNTFHPDHMREQTGETFANTMHVDENFFSVMNINMIEGRNFDISSSADQGDAYIINETAVRQFKLKRPVGERFVERGDTEGRIIGVVKDFHFESTAHKVNALVISYDSIRSYGYMFIKTLDARASIAHLERIWKNFYPNSPLEYSFQDDYLNRLYNKERQEEEVVAVFAGMSIFIALLGLFGLSSFMTLKRIKEIGIRKTLGASNINLINLLNREFIILVSVAFALSVPVAWIMMNEWLASFAKKISISPTYFIVTFIGSLALTFLVTGYHAIKVALNNPVKALRTE